MEYIEDKNSFQSLKVWQKSEAIDKVTESLSEHEKFGLTSQLRRAAISISANIAEGHGRRTNGDFARLLSTSFGSTREAQTLVMTSLRLKYIPKDGNYPESCE